MIPYPNIDPVALSLGPFVLRWYGLMFVIGFAVAWWLGRRRAAKPDSGWSARDIDNLIVYCIAGLVVGGRVGYAIVYNFPYFLDASSTGPSIHMADKPPRNRLFSNELRRVLTGRLLLDDDRRRRPISGRFVLLRAFFSGF